MSNYTINISVEGGKITATENILYADSVEYVAADFDFDQSWQNLLKTAIFRVDELIYAIPLEEDSCLIPREALLGGILHISVFGVLGNTRATTGELPIKVENSGYVRIEPEAPSPDPYNYYIEKVTELKGQAVDSAKEASDAAASASANASAVSEALDSIAEHSVNAKTAADNAAKSETEALSALESATLAQNDAEAAKLSAIQSAQTATNAGEKALKAVTNGIEAHNSNDNNLAHPNIVAIANEAKQIALGKAKSLCFNTKAELDAFLNGDFIRADGKTVADLAVGDNLYVLELNVPDYWWDGNEIQPLGAEKPDLSDFYTKEDIDSRISNLYFKALSSETYAAAYANGSILPGCIYFVYEEE